jgi:hypothetical protein
MQISTLNRRFQTDRGTQGSLREDRLQRPRSIPGNPTMSHICYGTRAGGPPVLTKWQTVRLCKISASRLDLSRSRNGYLIVLYEIFTNQFNSIIDVYKTNIILRRRAALAKPHPDPPTAS